MAPANKAGSSHLSVRFQQEVTKWLLLTAFGWAGRNWADVDGCKAPWHLVIWGTVSGLSLLVPPSSAPEHSLSFRQGATIQLGGAGKEKGRTALREQR